MLPKFDSLMRTFLGSSSLRRAIEGVVYQARCESGKSKSRQDGRRRLSLLKDEDLNNRRPDHLPAKKSR